MKLRHTTKSFTIIEILIAVVFMTVLFGTSAYLLITSLRATDANIENAGVREDLTFAMERVVRDLKGAAQGSLSQYNSIAHTLQFDDLNGDTYVYYLYNPDDTTLNSTYGESFYDLRKANITGGWTEIIYDEFESGYGNWIDGGSDCIHYTGGMYAHQGSGAVDLQDNSRSSHVNTGDLALSGYTEVLVGFWYYSVGLNSGHDFWLQISTNGGSNYSTVQSWVKGTDFNNGTFYQESVTITGYTLTDQTRIRFRLDAQNNNDDVYFDEVGISASTGSAESPASGEGLLVLKDLVSPDATEPATDLTISGNEVTLDLVVERGSEMLSMRTKVRPRNL